MNGKDQELKRGPGRLQHLSSCLSSCCCAEMDVIWSDTRSVWLSTFLCTGPFGSCAIVRYHDALLPNDLNCLFLSFASTHLAMNEYARSKCVSSFILLFKGRRKLKVPTCPSLLSAWMHVPFANCYVVAQQTRVQLQRFNEDNTKTHRHTFHCKRDTNLKWSNSYTHTRTGRLQWRALFFCFH